MLKLKELTFDLMYRLFCGISLRFLKVGRMSLLFEKLRTNLLRKAGADIHITATVRANVFVANPLKLTIGKRSKIGEYSRLFNFDDLFIGDDVEIGTGFLVYTNEHIFEGNASLAKQGAKTAPAIISNDCYIGANVTVLGGVTIGTRCVIGACTLVNKDLEPGYLYAGVPARKVRKLNG
jgi:maltose O-acetyltransferase